MFVGLYKCTCKKISLEQSRNIRYSYLWLGFPYVRVYRLSWYKNYGIPVLYNRIPAWFFFIEILWNPVFLTVYRYLGLQSTAVETPFVKIYYTCYYVKKLIYRFELIIRSYSCFKSSRSTIIISFSTLLSSSPPLSLRHSLSLRIREAAKKFFS